MVEKDDAEMLMVHNLLLDVVCFVQEKHAKKKTQKKKKKKSGRVFGDLL